eukprot:gene17718-19489_t
MGKCMSRKRAEGKNYDGPQPKTPIKTDPRDDAKVPAKVDVKTEDSRLNAKVTKEQNGGNQQHEDRDDKNAKSLPPNENNLKSEECNNEEKEEKVTVEVTKEPQHKGSEETLEIIVPSWVVKKDVEYKNNGSSSEDKKTAEKTTTKEGKSEEKQNNGDLHACLGTDNELKDGDKMAEGKDKQALFVVEDLGSLSNSETKSRNEAGEAKVQCERNKEAEDNDSKNHDETKFAIESRKGEEPREFEGQTKVTNVTLGETKTINTEKKSVTSTQSTTEESSETESIQTTLKNVTVYESETTVDVQKRLVMSQGTEESRNTEEKFQYFLSKDDGLKNKEGDEKSRKVEVEVDKMETEREEPNAVIKSPTSPSWVVIELQNEVNVTKKPNVANSIQVVGKESTENLEPCKLSYGEIKQELEDEGDEPDQNENEEQGQNKEEGFGNGGEDSDDVEIKAKDIGESNEVVRNQNTEILDTSKPSYREIKQEFENESDESDESDEEDQNENEEQDQNKEKGVVNCEEDSDDVKLIIIENIDKSDKVVAKDAVEKSEPKKATSQWQQELKETVQVWSEVFDMKRELFLESFANKTIMLKDLNIEGRSVNGVVAVKKSEAATEVNIRYTFNAWTTFSNAEAKKIDAEDDACDLFSFSMSVPMEHSVEFAVSCTTTSGTQVWDSNDGTNYKVNSTTSGQLVANFKSAEDAFIRYLQQRGICLSWSGICDDQPRMLIAVLKKDGIKNVGVKYTLDGWKSSAKVDATFDGERNLNGTPCVFYTTFVKIYPGAKRLEFCLFVEYNNDNKFWDNNNTKNYFINLSN